MMTGAPIQVHGPGSSPNSRVSVVPMPESIGSPLARITSSRDRLCPSTSVVGSSVANTVAKIIVAPCVTKEFSTRR